MSMVRVSDTAHRSLKELSIVQGMPMHAILEEAIEAYRKRTFLEKLNEDFAALHENEAEWDNEVEERALWNVTLAVALRPGGLKQGR